MLSLIVAMDPQRVIGKGGTLPWHIPEDFQHFKQTTLDSAVIMGKTTWLSIGRPLPDRKNIVVSTTLSSADVPLGVFVVSSLHEAIAEAQETHETVFLIGGVRIFSEGLSLVDQLVISFVHESYEGDTFFPEIDFSQWDEVKKVSYADFDAITYVRKA